MTVCNAIGRGLPMRKRCRAGGVSKRTGHHFLLSVGWQHIWPKSFALQDSCKRSPGYIKRGKSAAEDTGIDSVGLQPRDSVHSTHHHVCFALCSCQIPTS